MSRKVEKLISISCSKCLHVFIEKVKIKRDSEDIQTTVIDINCPECKSLVTVEIDGKIMLDRISLRQYIGKPKTQQNDLEKHRLKSL